MNENITDITQDLGIMYYPISALVFYISNENYRNTTYVEHFDMDDKGNPINAHPLTIREANVLRKMLNVEETETNACFTSKGLLPKQILHLNSSDNGNVIWFTKPQKRKLFFIKNLGIPNGMAFLPTLIWKANKTTLSVYAVKGKRRPTENTKLYYAPFFNVYENGNICMGTVDIQASKATSLEEFIHLWEEYFFNSYFSHLLDNYCPTKLNTVTLWKELVNTDKPFPTHELKSNNQTLQDLI